MKNLKSISIILSVLMLCINIISCSDNNDPSYTYYYNETLTAFKVKTSTDEVEFNVSRKSDNAMGIVISTNKSDIESIESLGLMQLWTDSELYYKYEYRKGDIMCKWQELGDTRGFFTFDSLTPNTTYYYRVFAQGTATEGNDIVEYRIVYGDVYSFTTLKE